MSILSKLKNETFGRLVQQKRTTCYAITLVAILSSLLFGIFVRQDRSKSNVYTLTIAGSQADDRKRIDLFTHIDNKAHRGLILLTFTNLSEVPIQYRYHSTGPDLKWEYDFKGTIYELENSGIGSGVNEVKDLKNGETDILEIKLIYPYPLKEAIYAANGWDSLYIKVKIRVTLTVASTAANSNDGYLSVTSDWTSFRLGIPHES